MARGKKKENLSLEEKLERALVPVEEQPYEVPGNWCWVKLNAISEIYTGNSINERIKREKYLYQPEGLDFIATKDVEFDNSIVYNNGVKINDYDKFKVAPENTSLLCIEGGSAGRKLGFTKEKVCFGNKLCAFVSKGCVSKYIYYYLQSNVFYSQFIKQRHGLIGGVSVKDLSGFLIPVATLSEQQRIVERIERMFAKLDEARDNVTEIKKTYLARKAAILSKAFTGELTLAWRNQNNICDSWSEKTFGEVAMIESNLVEPNEYQDFPHIAPDNIEKRTGVLLSYNTIAEDGVTSGKHRFYPGQILYSKIRPYLSKVVTVDFDGLCSADMYPIETKENTRYLWYYMLSDEFLRQASSAGSRSVLPKINRKELSEILVNIPSAEEQEEVVKILDRILPYEQKVVEYAKGILEQINVMKKTILSKAFCGELGTNNPAEESAIELLKTMLVET